MSTENGADEECEAGLCSDTYEQREPTGDPRYVQLRRYCRRCRAMTGSETVRA